MRKKIVFEPMVLGIGAFFMYLSGPTVLLLLAALAGCSAKSVCGAPLGPFSILMIVHWIIVGLVLKRHFLAAKWLLVIFVTIPFIALMALGFPYDFYSTSFWLIALYLFVFGVLFYGIHPF